MLASTLNPQTESVLLKVVVQLIVIMAAARISAKAFRAIRQPGVCGEIAAGLVLGPSLFGHFFPAVSKFVFNPSVGAILSVFSQVGLVFLMFLIGLVRLRIFTGSSTLGTSSVCQWDSAAVFAGLCVRRRYAWAAWPGRKLDKFFAVSSNRNVNYSNSDSGSYDA
jgi:hypothetical protein